MKKLYLILVFLLGIITTVQASEIKADPTLIITTLDGKIFDLKENRSKVVIVNFWAKWCVNCRKKMMVLDEIYREYQSTNLAHNLEIIGINIDHKRERQKISKISSSLSYPNAMFIDAKETNFEEPSTIPVSYIFNKDGKLVKKISANDAMLTKQDYEEILKPLITTTN